MKAEWRPVAFFVAMLSVFDIVYSLLSTCPPPYGQATNQGSPEYHCSAFAGLIPQLISIISEFLKAYEHELIAGFTIVLAISTIGLWISTRALWQAGDKQIAAAQRSADIAEKALVAANRPWIKIDFQAPKPIVYNINGANFTISYILKNTGHSPAMNVFVTPRIILRHPKSPPEAINYRQLLLQEISRLKHEPPSRFGFTLFPDETAVLEISVTASNDEIKKATELIGAIYPVIYGGVSYKIGFDAQSHQTGFVFEVRRADVPRKSTIEGNRSAMAIWVDEGDVPASDVRLLQSIIDGGYAD